MEQVAVGGQVLAPGQVAGGYLVMSVPQLVLPWALYESKRLQLIDVRVWFACAEMRCRRRFTDGARKPVYKLSELVALVGGKGPSRVRASLKRLRDVGLISWDGATLELASSPDQVDGDLSEFWDRLGLIQNNRRKVPLPRRLVRFIAGGTSRAETATILAHLLRCCYLRDGGVRSVGNCLASWVEELFGVHATRVKQARARLIRSGIFLEQVMPQWHRNRYGSRIEVNLAWSRAFVPELGEGGVAKAGTTGTESRPLASVPRPQSATPKENRNLPTEGKNQNLGAEPQTPKPGVFQRTDRKAESSNPAAPTLKHIVLEDLSDPKRLLELHAAAAAMKQVPEGERGQLEFFALAEHARSYATKSAPGLFASLVRNYGTWGRRFITQDDEESARARLRQLFEPTPRPAAEKRPSIRLDVPEKGPQSVGALLDVLLTNVRGGAATMQTVSGGTVPDARCSLNVEV